MWYIIIVNNNFYLENADSEPKFMKQVTKNILYEKFDGIVLYLAHSSLCAKYRTITFFLLIRPCFLAFYTTIAFKSYIPATFP